MYMVFIEVCLWTLLAFVLTWTTYHVTNRRKKTTKLADAAVEEIRDGGPDVIVVGAGVGGSALAYALAKDGLRVHVIERNMREPERMMGEFMQPEGRLMLSKLDLQCMSPLHFHCLSFKIKFVRLHINRLFGGNRRTESHRLNTLLGRKRSPSAFSGRVFYNGRFVQRLRQKASSLPKNFVIYGN
ncbi:hypothetical protein YC2023_020466 [Brassica napus]|uniref:Squalene monooxygenase n=1 Tax=Brassica oleracea var. oleracea TaxID=109376 RepID=A0A0D3AXY5_BRAOL